jgi:hypothetical protein
MDLRLSAIRAALNVGLVVRLSPDEMGDMIHHLQRFDIIPAGLVNPTAKLVIEAFRLESLAMTWDARVGAFLWLLVPAGARDPQGELGGAARVVALRWGPTGNALYDDAGTFVPSSTFLSAMAEKCESRASGSGAGCVPCVPPGLSNLAETDQPSNA